MEHFIESVNVPIDMTGLPLKHTVFIRMQNKVVSLNLVLKYVKPS
jgi:hypothetical protein